MKTLKNAFFFTFVAIFLISCGGGNGTDTTNLADSTATEASTNSGQNTSTTGSNAPEEEDASGKITDDVVKQACNCQGSARKADKTIDYPKMGACMGNKNKIQFVAELLGATATDKQRADAERVLTKKMDSKCPK